MRALALSTVLLITTAAHAADISIAPDLPRQQPTIFVNGKILPDDDIKFRDISILVPRATVALTSPGGNVSAAIAIGELVRYKLYETYVPDRRVRADLAGRQSILRNARIGFHASGWGDTGRESGVGNALEGAYFARLGFDYSAVRFFTEAPPNAMQWLTPEKARQFGISIHVYGAPPRGPSVLGY